MTNNIQHKQHKVIHKIDERLSAIETIILIAAKIASAIVTAIGFVGFIITLYIDPIRGRHYEFDWLQMLGMAIFLGLFLIGAALATIVNRK